MSKLETINKSILVDLDVHQRELVSDGYHTFQELYEFRMAYNAALFNEWAREWYIYENTRWAFKDVELHYTRIVKYDVHKSWRHNDGELCFGGGWFIVSANLPGGLISNHYEEKYWDLFKVPKVEKAKYEYDGHTAQDVLTRLKEIL